MEAVDYPSVAKPQPVSNVTMILSPTPDSPAPSSTTRPRRAAASKLWRDGPAKLRNISYRMTSRRALIDNTHKKTALAAVKEAIDNMITRKVMKPIKYEDLRKGQMRNIIPMHMFLKERFRSDGSFDRWKARLVANGNHQSPDTIGNTYAPTVNPITVMTLINLTATSAEHTMT